MCCMNELRMNELRINQTQFRVTNEQIKRAKLAAQMNQDNIRGWLLSTCACGLFIERPQDGSSHLEPDLFAVQLCTWPSGFTIARHKHAGAGEYHPSKNHQNTCKHNTNQDDWLPAVHKRSPTFSRFPWQLANAVAE
jgi:hypothetical protein